VVLSGHLHLAVILLWNLRHQELFEGFEVIASLLVVVNEKAISIN